MEQMFKKFEYIKTITNTLEFPCVTVTMKDDKKLVGKLVFAGLNEINVRQKGTMNAWILKKENIKDISYVSQI